MRRLGRGMASVSIIAGVALTVLSLVPSPALAALAPVEPAQISAGDGAVTIRHFVGRLVIEEGDQLAVQVMAAPLGGPLDMTSPAEGLVIEGDEAAIDAIYQARWRAWSARGRSGEGQEGFVQFLSDYPVMRLSLPPGTPLSIETSALFIDGGGLPLAALALDNIFEVYGTIGSASSARLTVRGNSDLSLGAVDGDLAISIAGRGTVHAGPSQSASVVLRGSGEVELGPVAETASIDIRGSGDVIGEGLGQLDLHIGGSGDVRFGAIADGATIAINGSGDFEATRIGGPLSIAVNGSGDIDIGEGETTATSLMINGSGDVRFGGLATDPSVRIGGSGTVRIADYRGNVVVRGKTDDVRIGDLRFED